MNALWIGLGGFLGANARFYLGRLITHILGTTFPWATGIVNLSGAFLIGIVATLFADRLTDHEATRLFLIVGLLGGYTTFSSYTLESVALLQEGRILPALGYVIGSNVLGLLACAAGIALAKSL